MCPTCGYVVVESSVVLVWVFSILLAVAAGKLCFIWGKTRECEETTELLRKATREIKDASIRESRLEKLLETALSDDYSKNEVRRAWKRLK